MAESGPVGADNVRYVLTARQQVIIRDAREALGTLARSVASRPSPSPPAPRSST
jgi:hypothetical protein